MKNTQTEDEKKKRHVCRPERDAAAGLYKKLYRLKCLSETEQDSETSYVCSVQTMGKDKNLV
jgi:hypothetical protein